MTQQLVEARQEEKQTVSFAYSLGLTPSRTKEKYENQQSNICSVGRASTSAVYGLGPDFCEGNGNKSRDMSVNNNDSRPLFVPKNIFRSSPKNIVGAKSGGSLEFTKTGSRTLNAVRSLVNEIPFYMRTGKDAENLFPGHFNSPCSDGDDMSLWRSPRTNKGNTQKYEDFKVPVTRSNGQTNGHSERTVSPVFQ